LVNREHCSATQINRQRVVGRWQRVAGAPAAGRWAPAADLWAPQRVVGCQRRVVRRQVAGSLRRQWKNSDQGCLTEIARNLAASLNRFALRQGLPSTTSSDPWTGGFSDAGNGTSSATWSSPKSMAPAPPSQSDSLVRAAVTWATVPTGGLGQRPTCLERRRKADKIRQDGLASCVRVPVPWACAGSRRLRGIFRRAG
jgi:hypothetical protein